MKRPRDKTLRDVVTYLESIGLWVYGDYIDLSTGKMLGGGCMNYHPDDVVRYRKLEERDLILPYDPQ